MIGRILAGLVLVGLAWLTAQRVSVWQSDETLWAAAVAAHPTDVRALVNLGVVRAQAGDIASARSFFERARALAWAGPVYDRAGGAMANLNLAVLDLNQGHFHQAQSRVLEARQLDDTVRIPQGLAAAVR